MTVVVVIGVDVLVLIAVVVVDAFAVDNIGADVHLAVDGGVAVAVKVI